MKMRFTTETVMLATRDAYREKPHAEHRGWRASPASEAGLRVALATSYQSHRPEVPRAGEKEGDHCLVEENGDHEHHHHGNLQTQHVGYEQLVLGGKTPPLIQGTTSPRGAPGQAAKLGCSGVQAELVESHRFHHGPGTPMFILSLTHALLPQTDPIAPHPAALGQTLGRCCSSPCYLTIIVMTTEPAKIRWRCLSLGKCGSSAPITGFIIVMGAVAANWGCSCSSERGGKASAVPSGFGPCNFGRCCRGPDPTSMSSNSEQSQW